MLPEDCDKSSIKKSGEIRKIIELFLCKIYAERRKAMRQKMNGRLICTHIFVCKLMNKADYLFKKERLWMVDEPFRIW